MILRIDYDKFPYRITDTFYMLKAISTPCQVRVSASGEGLHIVKDGDYTYDDPLYIAYDDPRRLRMNRIRQQNGVSHNILWDVKRGKRPGSWIEINNIADVLTFMTQLGNTNDNYFKVSESFIYPLTNLLAGVNQKMEEKLSEIRSRIDVLLDDIADSMDDINLYVGEIKELMVKSGERIKE